MALVYGYVLSKMRKKKNWENQWHQKNICKKVSVELITEGISPSGHSGVNLIISRFWTSVTWPNVDWTKKDTWLKQNYEKQFAKASEGPFFVNCLIQKEAARCRGSGRAQPVWAFRQVWVPRTGPWLCFKGQTHCHHIYWMQLTAKNLRYFTLSHLKNQQTSVVIHCLRGRKWYPVGEEKKKKKVFAPKS